MDMNYPQGHELQPPKMYYLWHRSYLICILFSFRYQILAELVFKFPLGINKMWHLWMNPGSRQINYSSPPNCDLFLILTLTKLLSLYFSFYFVLNMNNARKAKMYLTNWPGLNQYFFSPIVVHKCNLWNAD